MTEQISFKPIGTIYSCFGQKLGIPRQPGLASSARALLVIPYTQSAQIKESVRGLEGFSHIWVIFVFHRNNITKPVGLVRPPRLGGEKKVGTFASRSPNRPNPIGLSVVRLLTVRDRGDRIELEVQGGDFLDSTPVLDLKPYLPYADRIDDAKAAWVAPIEDQLMQVHFTHRAKQAISDVAEKKADIIFNCIKESLSLDPRPSFSKKSSKINANRKWSSLFFGFDVSWSIDENLCIVEDAELKDAEVLEKLMPR